MSISAPSQIDVPPIMRMSRWSEDTTQSAYTVNLHWEEPGCNGFFHYWNFSVVSSVQTTHSASITPPCSRFGSVKICVGVSVRHKYKSKRPWIYRKFGVEWHRDINKDFTQIYCVVECCGVLRVTWLDILRQRTQRLHEGNAWPATIQTSKIALSSHDFFYYSFFFRLVAGVVKRPYACSAWCSSWHWKDLWHWLGDEHFQHGFGLCVNCTWWLDDKVCPRRRVTRPFYARIEIQSHFVRRFGRFGSRLW